MLSRAMQSREIRRELVRISPSLAYFVIMFAGSGVACSVICYDTTSPLYVMLNFYTYFPIC